MQLYQRVLLPGIRIAFGEVDGEYMIHVCLEFIRVSLEYNVRVHKEALLTIITLVLKQQKHLVLHFLLQYRILQDSPVLAKALCILGSEKLQFPPTTSQQEALFRYAGKQLYKPALQAGIDMLYRL